MSEGGVILSALGLLAFAIGCLWVTQWLDKQARVRKERRAFRSQLNRLKAECADLPVPRQRYAGVPERHRL